MLNLHLFIYIGRILSIFRIHSAEGPFYSILAAIVFSFVSILFILFYLCVFWRSRSRFAKNDVIPATRSSGQSETPISPPPFPRPRMMRMTHSFYYYLFFTLHHTVTLSVTYHSGGAVRVSRVTLLASSYDRSIAPGNLLLLSHLGTLSKYSPLVL